MIRLFRLGLALLRLNQRLITLGGKLKPIEINLTWLSRGYGGVVLPKAITLWPFILYRVKNDGIVAHELSHWVEIARVGPLVWYPLYLIFEAGRLLANLALKPAGKHLPMWWHPLERAGYRIQWLVNDRPELVAEIDQLNERDVMDDIARKIFDKVV